MILTGQFPRVGNTATLELGASRSVYLLAGNNLPADLALVIGSAADVAAGNTLTLNNGRLEVFGPPRRASPSTS